MMLAPAERARAQCSSTLSTNIIRDWVFAPPIDFAASFDSLDIMERVMQHFYLRALIEERMGVQAAQTIP